jgi:hypothetical protein
MTNELREIKLTKEELDCLRELSSECSLGAFPQPTTLGGAEVAVHLDRTTAERFRELLGDRLARDGFDENYEPNLYGRLLEGLIDKLFQP